jgi:hypothetical protein
MSTGDYEMKRTSDTTFSAGVKLGVIALSIIVVILVLRECVNMTGSLP